MQFNITLFSYHLIICPNSVYFYYLYDTKFDFLFTLCSPFRYVLN
jgi:hypothetical protein